MDWTDPYFFKNPTSIKADELKKKFPEKAWLFDSYIKSRQAECDEIEEDLMPVTMLLQVR
jgi:hypothetical protein